MVHLIIGLGVILLGVGLVGWLLQLHGYSHPTRVKSLLVAPIIAAAALVILVGLSIAFL